MQVYWMLHGVLCISTVVNANFLDRVQRKGPVYFHVLTSRGRLTNQPVDFVSSRTPVHHGHGTGPFDRWKPGLIYFQNPIYERWQVFSSNKQVNFLIWLRMLIR